MDNVTIHDCHHCSCLQVNTDKECPFWPDDRQCGSKECGISTCDDEVPAGLKRPAVITTVCHKGAGLGGLRILIGVGGALGYATGVNGAGAWGRVLVGKEH